MDTGVSIIGSDATSCTLNPFATFSALTASSGVSTGGGGSLNFSSTVSGPRFLVRSSLGAAGLAAFSASWAGKLRVTSERVSPVRGRARERILMDLADDDEGRCDFGAGIRDEDQETAR